MRILEEMRIRRETKRLREQMSKLGYSKHEILTTLWLYDVSL